MSRELLLSVLTPPSIRQPGPTPVDGLIVPSDWVLDLSPESPDSDGQLPAPVESQPAGCYFAPDNKPTDEQVERILEYLGIPLIGQLREDWEIQWRLGYMNLGEAKLEKFFPAWHAARWILGDTSFRTRCEGRADVAASAFWPSKVAARAASATVAAEVVSEPFPERTPSHSRPSLLARILGHSAARPALEAAPTQKITPVKHQK